MADEIKDGAVNPQGAAAGDGQAKAPDAGTGSPTPTGAPGSTDKAQAPAWTEHEITVDGKKVKLSRAQVDELSSKGYDYTRKTQGLADERRKFQEERSRLESQIREEEARRWQAAYGRKPEETEVDPMDQLRSEQASLKQQVEDGRLEMILSGIKREFPGVDENELLVAALARKVPMERLPEFAKEHSESLNSRREALLEELLKDEKNPKVSAFRQAAIDEYLAAKAKEGKPKGETGGAGGPSGAGPTKRITSLDEGDRRAKELLAQLP